eukprot:5929585-Amphidinium_carterae.1
MTVLLAERKGEVLLLWVPSTSHRQESRLSSEAGSVMRINWLLVGGGVVSSPCQAHVPALCQDNHSSGKNSVSTREGVCSRAINFLNVNAVMLGRREMRSSVTKLVCGVAWTRNFLTWQALQFGADCAVPPEDMSTTLPLSSCP